MTPAGALRRIDGRKKAIRKPKVGSTGRADAVARRRTDWGRAVPLEIAAGELADAVVEEGRIALQERLHGLGITSLKAANEAYFIQ